MIFGAEQVTMRADRLWQEVNPSGVRVGNSHDPTYFIQPADVAASVVHSLGLPRDAEITDLTLRPKKPLPTA